DLIAMDVLGFDSQPKPQPPPTIGGIDYRVAANGGTTATPTSYVGPAAITAAGYQFVIEYIGTANNAGFLRPSDASALLQQNLSIVSVFAKSEMSDKAANGNYSNAWTTYFNNHGALGQGTADAIEAINAARAAGQTSGAIYFAIDLNPLDVLRSGISENAALSEIGEYFHEISAYFAQAGAPYGIGVYGASDTLSSLLADPSAGVKYRWLSDRLSGQILAGVGKNLEQTDTSGGALVSGHPVDLDTAYTPDFGQWSGPPIANLFFQDLGGDSLAGTAQIWRVNSRSVISQTAMPDPGPQWVINGTGDVN